MLIRMKKLPWQNGGAEPTLRDVLADPIVQTLMKADRVTCGEVLKASARVHDHCAAREREDVIVPA